MYEKWQQAGEKDGNLTVVSGVGPTDLRWVEATHPSNCQFVVACPNWSCHSKSRHRCKIKPANLNDRLQAAVNDKYKKSPPKLANVVVGLVHSEGASGSSSW